MGDPTGGTAVLNGEGRDLRFGLAYASLDGDRVTASDPTRRFCEPHWAEIIEQVVWAESLGFDSIWFSEHHFEGMAPSPLILTAAAAMRTSSVRFSNAVMLAPLYHPVRLAEEAAMVSVLSGGRYDLGISMGYEELEYEVFNVNPRHRPSLMDETIDIVRHAWAGEPFAFQGKRFRFPEITVTPVPQSPPRIIMGGHSEPAIRRAALIGDGYVTSKETDLRMYAEALRSCGRTGFAVASQVAMIVEDPEREVVELEPYGLNYMNAHFERGFVKRESPFKTLQEAVDEGHYHVWDGDMAVSAIADTLTRNPVVNEVIFLASAGPGEAVQNSYPRIQYIRDFVVPELRRRFQTSNATDAP